MCLVCAASLGGSAAAAPQGTLASAAAPGASPFSLDLAVNPFVNLSGRPADDWIGDGIAETVATDLRTRGWTVATCSGPAAQRGGRTAAAPGEADNGHAVNGDAVSGPAPARCPSPQARTLIDGAFQRLGASLRITARVVDAETGAVAHRARLDGTVDELFGLQDQLVTTLAASLAAGARARPMSTPVTGSLAFSPDPDTGGDSVPAPLPASVPQRRGGLSGFAIGERPRAVAASTTEPPRIDGRLDDAVWSAVDPITNFVQTSPVEGAPGTERTEVWIAYDRDHLYIAFYAHYSDPSIIRANGRSATSRWATTGWRCCSTRSWTSSAPTSSR